MLPYNNIREYIECHIRMPKFTTLLITPALSSPQTLALPRTDVTVLLMMNTTQTHNCMQMCYVDAVFQFSCSHE